MSDHRLPPAPPELDAPPINGSPAPPAQKRTRWLVPVVAAVALILIVGTVAYTSGVNHDAGGKEPSAGAASPGFASPAPSAPLGLRAAAGPFFVKLTWRPAADASDGTRYEIDRGAHFDAVTDNTSFTDVHVVPGTIYEYRVIALTKSGGRSDSAHVKIKTASAPASSGRLQGVFNVSAVSTSHYGFSSFNSDKTTFGWRFDPACQAGECNVQLVDLHNHDASLSLTRSGGTYHGFTTMKGFGSCNGITTTASVTVDLHVDKAQALKDEWRVSHVSGKLLARTSQQLGCVASGIDYRLTGTLAGLA